MKQWILQEYDDELPGYVDVTVVDAIASKLLQIEPRLGALVEEFPKDPMEPLHSSTTIKSSSPTSKRNGSEADNELR